MTSPVLRSLANNVPILFIKISILCFFPKCGVQGKNVLISAKLIFKAIGVLHLSN